MHRFSVDNAYTDDVRFRCRVHEKAKLATAEQFFFNFASRLAVRPETGSGDGNVWQFARFSAEQLPCSRKELAFISGAAPLQVRRVRTLPLPRGEKPLHSSTVRRWAEQALWVRNDRHNDVNDVNV